MRKKVGYFGLCLVLGVILLIGYQVVAHERVLSDSELISKSVASQFRFQVTSRARRGIPPYTYDAQIIGEDHGGPFLVIIKHGDNITSRIRIEKSNWYSFRDDGGEIVIEGEKEMSSMDGVNIYCPNCGVSNTNEDSREVFTMELQEALKKIVKDY